MSQQMKPEAEFLADPETGCLRCLRQESSSSSFSYSDGEQVEVEILRRVTTAEDRSYDSVELEKETGSWPLRYHLGRGRAAAFQCLDFNNIQRVLDVGSGCGALTRYLGERFPLVDALEGSLLRAQITRERCRDLANVRVFRCTPDKIEFENTYDLIVANGVLEYAPLYDQEEGCPKDSCQRMLASLGSKLSDDGVLLLAIENKIGLKYWLGSPEDHSGRLYDGIHGYPLPQTPVTFSRNELQGLLAEAGFSHCDFYYCFPDYKFPSVIVSDLPGDDSLALHNWIDTPFAQHGLRRNYTAHDALVLRTMNNAGLLREFANSFLVAAGRTESRKLKSPEWYVRKIQLRRRPEFQCRISFLRSPRVIKRQRLSGKCEPISRKTGPLTATHKVSTNCSWIPGDLVLFKLYEILQQPDFSSAIQGFMRRYARELLESHQIGNSESDSMPVLSGKAVDFIPRNLIEVNGRYLCIDEEWELDTPLPLDYLLFRCVAVDLQELNYPWLLNKIEDKDSFRIEVIRTVIPDYSSEMDQINKQREHLFRACTVYSSD